MVRVETAVRGHRHQRPQLQHQPHMASWTGQRVSSVAATAMRTMVMAAKGMTAVVMCGDWMFAAAVADPLQEEKEKEVPDDSSTVMIDAGGLGLDHSHVSVVAVVLHPMITRACACVRAHTEPTTPTGSAEAQDAPAPALAPTLATDS